MAKKDMITLACAALFGFFGGTVTRFNASVAAANPGVVQATRFELLDQGGTRVAFLGVDKENGVMIAFPGKGDFPRAAFGLSNDGSPFLRIAGPDGVTRAVLQLGPSDEPILAMGDSKWEGRILLGFVGDNRSVSTQKREWSLLFNAPGITPNVARIGLIEEAGGKPSGVLYVRDRTGRMIRSPHQ